MSLKLNKDNDYLLMNTAKRLGHRASAALKQLLDAEEGKHVILDLSVCNALAGIETLHDLQRESMDANQSFIILVGLEQMGQFDEDMAVVPSMTEAIDWIEMDDMQRQLMTD